MTQYPGGRIPKQRADEHPIHGFRHGRGERRMDEHLALVTIRSDHEGYVVGNAMQVEQRLGHVHGRPSGRVGPFPRGGIPLGHEIVPPIETGETVTLGHTERLPRREHRPPPGGEGGTPREEIADGPRHPHEGALGPQYLLDALRAQARQIPAVHLVLERLPYEIGHHHAAEGVPQGIGLHRRPTEQRPGAVHEEMQSDHDGARALPEQRDVVRIAPERSDVPPHPIDRGPLIHQSEVPVQTVAARH
mmetsp:Transcript_21999/g.65092  ORF Transcript_21999/g.65092 Transcript_21999/m.65092 type:complete len:247 (+) Transcript_21999:2423-3163(+)